jgi:hypothetical protein
MTFEGTMLTEQERESFAVQVVEVVRRWSGVELRQHASGTSPNETDGVEFRLYGRQIGHLHGDSSVHVALTKGLKATVIREGFAEALPVAPTSGWAMFNPMTADDVHRAVWLLRLNYVRLRRQRMTLAAAASSDLLREHEAAVSSISPNVAAVLSLTQARSRVRPLPSLDA